MIGMSENSVKSLPKTGEQAIITSKGHGDIKCVSVDGKEFFIKEINYSFDLYYKVRVPNGQTSQGDIIWKDKEYGGVHFAITYGLSGKRQAVQLHCLSRLLL